MSSSRWFAANPDFAAAKAGFSRCQIEQSRCQKPTDQIENLAVNRGKQPKFNALTLNVAPIFTMQVYCSFFESVLADPSPEKPA